MLEEDKCYHIYNRGNNSQPIFYSKGNMEYFLILLQKYMNPVADIYAYCLLKNHYHIVARVKKLDEVNTQDFNNSVNKVPKKVSAFAQFTHFLNAYTKALNKQQGRTGKVFEAPFKSKELENEAYFMEALVYVHNNPVKHGLVKSAEEYHWSSYNSYFKTHNLNQVQKEIINYFGGAENFIASHKEF